MTPERQDHRVLRAIQDRQVLLAQQVQIQQFQVLPDLRVLQDPPVLRENKELQVLQVLLGILALLVPLGILALLVLSVLLEQLAQLETLDLQDHKDLLEPLEI